MKKGSIGLDLDDVLIEFNTSFCLYHNRVFDTSLRRSDIFDYAFDKVWGCSPEEILERIHAFFHSPEHDAVQPVEGAVEALENLGQEHELCIITARPETVRTPTLEVVERLFPHLASKVTIIGHPFQEKRKNKSELCREFGIDIFIEDAPIHVDDISKVVPKTFLFDTPWNARYQPPENVERVFSWKDIEDRIAVHRFSQ